MIFLSRKWLRFILALFLIVFAGGAIIYEYVFFGKTPVEFIGNIDTYSLTLHSKKALKLYKQDCNAKTCRVDHVIASEYDVTITATGYHTFTTTLTIKEDGNNTYHFSLVKKMLFTEQKDNQSTLGMKKKEGALLSYFGGENKNVYLAGNKVHGIGLYVYENDRLIVTFPYVEGKYLSIVPVYGENALGIILKNTLYLYDIDNGMMKKGKVLFPGEVLSIKKQNYKDYEYSITTKTGVYFYSFKTGTGELFPLFHDVVIGEEHSAIGLIRSFDEKRKQELKIPYTRKTNDIIVHYNMSSGTILSWGEIPHTVSYLFFSGSDIGFYDTIKKKYILLMK